MQPLPQLLDVSYTPAHWNHNCACMIPAGWTARVLTVPVTRSQPEFIARIMGNTQAEALEATHREFPELLKAGAA